VPQGEGWILGSFAPFGPMVSMAVTSWRPSASRHTLISSLIFPDWHPARFSFADRHASTPVQRAVPAFPAGVPDGKSVSGALA